MNDTLGDAPATDNTSANIQMISALILSIFAALSSLILHYKMKHFSACGIESDCITSPPPTPRVVTERTPIQKPPQQQSTI